MEWKKSNIKHSTLANSCEDVGLEDIDIFAKVINLQCSWMKKLFDKNFVTNFILVLLSRLNHVITLNQNTNLKAN